MRGGVIGTGTELKVSSSRVIVMLHVVDQKCSQY